MSNQKLTKIAILSATALVFGYIESLLPPLFLPGVKLGLSNIVILLALYETDKLTAFFIMLIKVIVSSILFAGMSTFFYSLSGGILSLIIMTLFKNRCFSLTGVSILGGVFHNIGQLISASIILGQNALYYFPVLLISGAVMGVITGFICTRVIKLTKKAMHRN